MARALWNGQVLAESDDCELVEGNVYFPPHAVDRSALRASHTKTVCSWKGVASYYTLVVDGCSNEDAAWYYADPKPAAANIRGYVAFWKGVEIED